MEGKGKLSRYLDIGKKGIFPPPPAKDENNWQEIIDNSSQQNRNALLLFVSACIVLLITTAGVQDKDYLITGHGVKLPVIDIEIPMDMYFFTAPLLLLVLHLDILYNLCEHRKKLGHWLDNGDDDSLWPFIYNNALTHDYLPQMDAISLIRHIRSKVISSVLMYIALYILPMSVLLYIANRYFPNPDRLNASVLKLQATPLYHGALVTIDILVMLIYYEALREPEAKNVERRWRAGEVSYFIVLFLLISSAVLACYRYCYVAVSMIINDKIENIAEAEKFNLQLKVPETDLMVKIPSNEEIHVYLQRAMDKLGNKCIEECENQREAAAKEARYQAFKDLGEGVDLRGKDLRYANFFKCDLRNAKVDKKTNFIGATFGEAKLQGADLNGARLRGVDLRRADLAGANLKGADLTGAQLQRADLTAAIMIGANLKNAWLLFATMNRANMQGAIMSDAKMQAANLEHAQMQGANLRNALLLFATMNAANMQGANMSHAKLQVANLGHAQMQGANMDSAIFDDADLTGSNFNGANMKYATFRGVNFNQADLRGAVAYGINITGIEYDNDTKITGMYLKNPIYEQHVNFIQAQKVYRKIIYQIAPDINNTNESGSDYKIMLFKRAHKSIKRYILLEGNNVAYVLFEEKTEMEKMQFNRKVGIYWGDPKGYEHFIKARRDAACISEFTAINIMGDLKVSRMTLADSNNGKSNDDEKQYLEIFVMLNKGIEDYMRKNCQNVYDAMVTEGLIDPKDTAKPSSTPAPAPSPAPAN